jgi:YcxB-like protein
MDTPTASVSVRFALKEAEVAAAYQTVALKRPWLWLIFLIGMFYALLAVQDLVSGDRSGNAAWHLGGGVVLVGMIAITVFVYPRWQFRRSARARGEQSHRFSDDGFEVSLSDSRSEAKWTFYQKVIATRDLYLLMHNNRLCNVIPRRAFASAADEALFVDILKRHVRLQRRDTTKKSSLAQQD